jgi:hypothetical protein
MRLANRANLSSEAYAALEAELREHHTLQAVVRWGLAQHPPVLVTEVVAQDEFTLDVALPWGDGLVLIYGAT